jgi:hypothetical protein
VDLDIVGTAEVEAPGPGLDLHTPDHSKHVNPPHVLDHDLDHHAGAAEANAQMKALHDTGTLRRHDWHPEWNYTLNPPQE